MSLPPELVFKTAMEMDSRNLYKLLTTNKNFGMLLDNEFFWKRKFIYDYGILVDNISDWKKLYMKYGHIHQFDDNETRRTSPKHRLKEISAGNGFYAGIDFADNVWCWGDNGFGQLGLGHDEHVYSPTQLGIMALQVSAGNSHILILDMNYQVWQTGQYSEDLFGSTYIEPTRLNLGKIVYVSAGENCSAVIDENYNVLWWTFSNIQPKKIHDFKAIQVAAGDGYFLAIDTENHVWEWSLDNNLPQLVEIGKAKKISVGKEHRVVLGLDNRVWVWGSNKYGQLGLGRVHRNFYETPNFIPNIKALHISAGGYHTALIDNNYRLLIFGSNKYSQLGLTTNGPVDTPIPYMADGKFYRVSAGLNSTLSIGNQIYEEINEYESDEYQSAEEFGF